MEIILNAAHLLTLLLDRVLAPWGLTFPQYRVLKVIAENGALNMFTIADAIGTTRGNVTGITDRLDAGGWIIRDRATFDRRQIILRLSESGEQRFNEARAAVDATTPKLPAELVAGLNQLMADIA